MTTSQADEPKDIETLTDGDLTLRARQGDQEAFGELVHRHRAKAVNWANNITQNLGRDYAEDVVQEALIKAFLHIGNLVNEERFVPWLQHIVRNQALMKVRRGGIHKKEQPFSAYLTLSSSVTSYTSGANQEDWSNLDKLLYHLATSDPPNQDFELDPSVQVQRREIAQMLFDLLHCLNKRERAIFEAHFFEQMSPSHIADLFETSVSNIYKILSRSRQKMKQAHFQVEFAQYLQPPLQARKEFRPMNATKILERPTIYTEIQEGTDWFVNAQCRTSLALSIYGALHYTSKALPLAQVMGLTSNAFRINIQEGEVSVAGPYEYRWEKLLPKSLLPLGFESEFVGQGNHLPPSPELLAETLQLIRHSVERGIPAIAWDLACAEWGLIYGYDDQKQLLHICDPESSQPRTLPYARLGRMSCQELFVITLETAFEQSPQASLRKALELILDHALRPEPKNFPGYINGLAAYDTWLQALQAGTVDAFGNSYNAGVVADARKFAAEFLKDLGQHWSAASQTGKTQQALLEQAAQEYSEVAEAMAQVQSLFVFPGGGDPHEATTLAKATQLLEQAREAEKKGVSILQNLQATFTQTELPY